MSEAPAVEMFGESWPDRERLATHSGFDLDEIEEIVDELQLIVKTATRLGWVLDLDTPVDAILAGDGDDPESFVTGDTHLLGHPQALRQYEGRLLNALGLLVPLGDRIRLARELSALCSVLESLVEQYRELADSGVAVSTAPRDLGLERMVEDAIELAPDLLSHHGYNIVGTPQRQVRLPSGRRLDLLAELDDGSLLVIELKRLAAGEAAVEQCSAYVEELRATSESVPVNGLVLGDGIDALEADTGRKDIQALPLRLLDLPTARAQRWLWWTSVPTSARERPDAVVAVAADGHTPVAVWSLSERAVPWMPGLVGSWMPEDDGWGCPVPLSWSRDHTQWSTTERNKLVASQLEYLAQLDD